MPKSATSKMGASGSLLMATMVRILHAGQVLHRAGDTFAMYSSGATILPVWPPCNSFGVMPASTSARELPVLPPSTSASRPTSRSKSSLFFSTPPARDDDFGLCDIGPGSCLRFQSLVAASAVQWRRWWHLEHGSHAKWPHPTLLRDMPTPEPLRTAANQTGLASR